MYHWKSRAVESDDGKPWRQPRRARWTVARGAACGQIAGQHPSEAVAAIVRHGWSHRAHGAAGAGIAVVSVTVNGFL